EISLLYFFFQAEDGIRDFHVTGVQTCALPILPAFRIATGSSSNRMTNAWLRSSRRKPASAKRRCEGTVRISGAAPDYGPESQRCPSGGMSIPGFTKMFVATR